MGDVCAFRSLRGKTPCANAAAMPPLLNGEGGKGVEHAQA